MIEKRGEARDWHAFGKESSGVSFGRQNRTPHPMRISLIIVRLQSRAEVVEWRLDEAA
jgi:hypothetical protein